MNISKLQEYGRHFAVNNFYCAILNGASNYKACIVDWRKVINTPKFSRGISKTCHTSTHSITLSESYRFLSSLSWWCFCRRCRNSCRSSMRMFRVFFEKVVECKRRFTCRKQRNYQKDNDNKQKLHSEVLLPFSNKISTFPLEVQSWTTAVPVSREQIWAWSPSDVTSERCFSLCTPIGELLILLRNKSQDVVFRRVIFPWGARNINGSIRHHRIQENIAPKNKITALQSWLPRSQRPRRGGKRWLRERVTALWCDSGQTDQGWKKKSFLLSLYFFLSDDATEHNRVWMVLDPAGWVCREDYRFPTADLLTVLTGCPRLSDK